MVRAHWRGLLACSLCIPVGAARSLVHLARLAGWFVVRSRWRGVLGCAFLLTGLFSGARALARLAGLFVVHSNGPTWESVA